MAEKEIGVTSDVNGSVNPRVLSYFKDINAQYVPGDDQVWCAAFVGAILEMCGIQSTKSLSARSYLNWGEATTSPVQGDVVVFWRDSIQSANGHVSFFHHEDENTVYCLGGNQGSGVVDIEGYPKTRVLGYRSAIKTSAPQEQTNNHMEPETTTAETPVETVGASPATPVAVKWTHFYDTVAGTVATYFNETKQYDNPGQTFAFKTSEEMLAESTVETFNFWDNVPMGLGALKA